MKIDLEENVYHFNPEDDNTINTHKTAELMTKITFGIKVGKSFRVILQEIPNPK